jgi:hypothetical protein
VYEQQLTAHKTAADCSLFRLVCEQQLTAHKTAADCNLVCEQQLTIYTQKIVADCLV